MINKNKLKGFYAVNDELGRLIDMYNNLLENEASDKEIDEFTKFVTPKINQLIPKYNQEIYTLKAKGQDPDDILAILSESDDIDYIGSMLSNNIYFLETGDSPF